MKQKYITITSLKKYQHYHDRHMPWFKWYADCLQSHDFMSLNCTQRWLFIGLICIAIKSNNCIIYDINWLQTTLRIKRIGQNCIALRRRQMIDFVYTNSTQIRSDQIRSEEEKKKIREEIKSSLNFNKLKIRKITS